MLETIRAYALEKLAEKGETDDVARLSAQYFRDLFRSKTGSPRQSRPRDKTSDRRELDNVRAAIDRALSPNGDQQIGLKLTAESRAAMVPVVLDGRVLPARRDSPEAASNKYNAR